MILQDQATFPSEINRDNSGSLIHNLFVFNKSGVCFYGRNFTDYIDVEKNLISPFITALMTFAKEMIGKPFKTIEMEDIKIVIFEKNSLYYSVLCDTFENLTFLDDIISQINEKITTYLLKNSININAEIIYDSDLNDTIEEVICKALRYEFNSKKEKKVIKILKNIKSYDDIEGITLLTDRGKVIYSSFGRVDLKTFLKEVEFRVKIYENSILKLFYTLKDKFIFSEYILNTYFIMLVFKSRVKFGLAEHYLTQIVNKIKSTLTV
ncbi:MAG: hypothetical protein ACXAC5_05795 [Promethearchaeota archaeon]|jgi:hypothetical protein